MCSIVPKVCARLKKTENDNVSISEIKEELKKAHAIETTDETIADILNEIERRNR